MGTGEWQIAGIIGRECRELFQFRAEPVFVHINGHGRTSLIGSA